MSVRSTEIREIIEDQIRRFGQELTVTNVGTVVSRLEEATRRLAE